jgi:hypothetical protein
MDFKKFMQEPLAFPLYVDTWEIAHSPPERVRTETIDFNALPRRPCTLAASSLEGARVDPGQARSPAAVEPLDDDCRLLALLEEFDPARPGHERAATGIVAPHRSRLKVLYFDFPGEDEKSWKREYVHHVSQRLPRQYESFFKAYVHPFIHTQRSPTEETLGYELVLQYWFFYPFNDGGNNHEGDWEHMNIVVTRKARGTDLLTADDVRRILEPERSAVGGDAGNGGEGGEGDTLVIARVEYYLHQKVMILDYLRPNVYLPRDEWEREVDWLPAERGGERDLWKRIRYLAYADRAETILNTHPVGYIGADNKGTDQLLAPPGGRNRNSHGTYPFPGLYKGVGPAGAAEQIRNWFDHRRTFADPSRPLPSAVERYDRPERIELVPDWERVRDLVRADPAARREWSWLVLPLRWGFPAASSPFAGIVPHAETGNLAPFGPAYNPGWNRVGAARAFELYEPHKVSALFPLGWQDNFLNSWGALNLTLPTLVSMPPFDFAWQVAGAPFRILFRPQLPTFYPAGSPQFRIAGVAGGLSFVFFPNDFVSLLTGPAQFEPIALLESDSSTIVVNRQATTAAGPAVHFNFYVGLFQSENMVRHARSDLRAEIRDFARGDATVAEGELEFWEYAGSLRHNLSKGGLQPFLKAGYGLSWYRVTDARLNGAPLAQPPIDWVRKPSILPPRHLLPNTWHFGAGLELIPVRSLAPFPHGIDIGLRADLEYHVHRLGLRRPLLATDLQDFTVGRFALNLQLTASY